MTKMRLQIVVIGSLNMDLVSYVPHHPLPGETITATQFQTSCGGKGGNQAVACAKLSRSVSPALDVLMVGCVGPDLHGRTIVDRLSRYGVEVTNVQVVSDSGGEPSVSGESQTGTAQIIVETSSGQNRIAVFPGANQCVSPDYLDRIPETSLPGLIILQLEIPLDTVQKVCCKARDRGIAVLLNPAPAQRLPVEIYNGLEHLILNETEASYLAGVAEEDLRLEAVLMNTAAGFLAMGVNNVVITRGGSGAFFATKTKSDTSLSGQVPAVKCNVVDTTAAGDTFIGAYAVAFVRAVAEGRPFDIRAAVEEAVEASAITISRRGAQESIPWREEIASWKHG